MMKHTSILLSVFLLPVYGISQGLINNGAYIVMNGATSNIYIDGANGNYLSQNGGIISPLVNGPTVTLLGNWTNNTVNSGFVNDGSTVVFSGANQTINGANPTVFDNVRLLGTGTKTLNVQTTVGGMGAVPVGVLSLGTRPLDLNGFELWITNPVGGAITTTTGYIQSETNVALNPSRVAWMTGTNTGVHVIPFGLAATQIPLTLNITSGMTFNTDYFYASTRATATSANTPWASTVTHMFDPTLAQDGSDEAVIDRWWEIQFVSAATANVTFSYRGSENTLQVPYNTGNLGAQYWDLGWLPDNSNIGSAPAVLAGVGSVTAPGLAFGSSVYTPLVLSSVLAPLPVELISFTANCNGNQVLNWSTASELNNDYFTVQRSDDGMTFRDIGQVNGAGTSSQQHNYSFIDPQPVSGIAYYRLQQTDYNGQSTVSKIITGETCGGVNDYIDAYNSGNGITITVNVGQATDYTVTVYDDRGRIMINRGISALEGSNNFLLNGIIPATGVYLVRVAGNDGRSFTKRLFLAVE